jgi:hypothetical protein
MNLITINAWRDTKYKNCLWFRSRHPTTSLPSSSLPRGTTLFWLSRIIEPLVAAAEHPLQAWTRLVKARNNKWRRWQSDVGRGLISKAGNEASRYQRHSYYYYDRSLSSRVAQASRMSVYIFVKRLKLKMLIARGTKTVSITSNAVVEWRESASIENSREWKIPAPPTASGDNKG